MQESNIANSLVAAHADRVLELVRLYGLLERACADAGADGAATHQVHHDLNERIVAWGIADGAAERHDMVVLTNDDREPLLRALDRAILHAERDAALGSPDPDQPGVASALRQMRAALPPRLARADLVRIHRSARRLETLETLNGPHFALGNEARVLLRMLEVAMDPIARSEVAFDPEDRFRGTLYWALKATVVAEPGATGGVDLGLGASATVASLLGAVAKDLGEVYERWVQNPAPSHPFARYPYVPRGRFCSVSATAAVASDLEATGPIGWAAGGDVPALAEALAAAAREQPRFAVELQAASRRVEAAAQRGHAVIGLVEYLPPESDGERQWLIDMEANHGNG